MNEGWAGWVEAHELPGAEQARTVAEILSAPPSPEERRALRREQAEADARRNSAQDTADEAAAAAFRARITGTPPRDVLAEAAAEPFRDREAHARRRAAIDVLRPYGLEDVVTGGQSGVIIDANMGVLEPERDVAQRAALDRGYEAERSERLAAEGRSIVERARVQLEERLRARVRSRSVSYRSAAPAQCSRAKFDREGYCGCLACATFDEHDRARAGRATGGEITRVATPGGNVAWPS